MEKKQHSLGKGLRSNKFKRGGMAALMSVVFIAIVVVVNVLVGILTQRFPSLNIDLTAKKLNTLSDQALETAQKVDEDTTIYLIGGEDAYREDQVYASFYSSYGVRMQSSQVVNLAEKLREANPKISVKFVDPDTDPKFISEHAADNLVTGKVLVETEKRSKALSAGDLFSLQANQSTGQYDVYSKVDSALAGALEMVNLDKVPVLTLATGHEEMLTSSNMGGFMDLLESQNFDVKEINFLTDEIPGDTQILMIPTPATDYTEEEIQKIRDYLGDDTREEPVTLLVTCHPTQAKLPNLDAFLEEWGVRPGEGIVGESDTSRMFLGSPAYVRVDAVGEALKENSYENLIAVSSAPLTLLFENSGDVSAQALWTTADTAYVATEDMTEADLDAAEKGAQVLASISSRHFQAGDDLISRNVVVFGSSVVFADTFMEAPAFSNREYTSDLVKYTTGTDGSAVTVSTEQVQTNSLDVTAPVGLVNLLGLGVFTLGLPLAILIVGMAIFLKRRHL